MAQTVNGMIARSNGETPWSEAEWKSFFKTAKEYPVLVMGSKTYNIMIKSKELEKISPKLIIVLSHKNKIKPQKGLVVVHSPREVINYLNQQKCPSALLIGGAKTNIAFLNEHFINEIIVDVEPLVFGKGIPLFAEGVVEARLRLAGIKKIGINTVQLRYKVGEVV